MVMSMVMGLALLLPGGDSCSVDLKQSRAWKVHRPCEPRFSSPNIGADAVPESPVARDVSMNFSTNAPCVLRPMMTPPSLPDSPVRPVRPFGFSFLFCLRVQAQ